MRVRGNVIISGAVRILVCTEVEISRGGNAGKVILQRQGTSPRGRRHLERKRGQRDSDVQAVSRWPILGDIPLIGQFFRSSAGRRNKRELVILVSPRILDDEESTYGYGYRPSTKEARRLLGAG